MILPNPITDPLQFSRDLTAEMERTGLTHKEVAAVLQIHTSCVGKWSRGSYIPKQLTQEGAMARMKLQPNKA